MGDQIPSTEEKREAWFKAEIVRLRILLKRASDHWDKITWTPQDEFEWQQIYLAIKEALAEKSEEGKG